MRKRLILILFAVFLSASAPAWAAADMEEEQEYDGYLICLEEDCAVLYSALPDGIEAVIPEAGVYQAATLEDAAYFPADAVRYIEPNYLVTLYEDEDPDAGVAWNLEMLGADAAWAAGLDGNGVRIGVVDSGLYAEHIALAGAWIIPGWDYVNDKDTTDDEVGHGTFVTAIIT